MDPRKEDRKTIQHHALELATDERAQLIEDNLWWLLGRKNIIRRFLNEANSMRRISKILDVGCGSGGVFDVLAEFGEVFGAKPSAILARRARERGIAQHVFEEDASKLEITRQVDIITMFDVLEHIEEDMEFLKQLRYAASEDHLILMSVPACQFLYSEHDKILHHQRRYSKQTLHKRFSESGYEVIKMSYFMFFLFPFALLERGSDKILNFFGKKRTAVNVGGNINPQIGNVLTKILAEEAILSNIVSFPIGLWLFALVRPGSSHNKKFSTNLKFYHLCV